MIFLASVPAGNAVQVLDYLKSISGAEVLLCASEEVFRAKFIGSESLNEIKATLADLGLSLKEK